MKKSLFLITVLLCLGMLFGCTQKPLQGIPVNALPEGFAERYNEVAYVTADRYALTKTCEDLTNVSDLIAVITPQAQENVLMHFNDGLVAFGYTKTTGKILQVLQGEIPVGNTVLITEECFTTDGGTVLHTQDGYLPMNVGESYLLFLKAYPANDPDYAGMYYPVDLEYGKYVLDSSGLPGEASSPQWNAVYQVTGAADLTEYHRWYQYVQKLYPEVFRSGS